MRTKNRTNREPKIEPIENQQYNQMRTKGEPKLEPNENQN